MDPDTKPGHLVFNRTVTLKESVSKQVAAAKQGIAASSCSRRYWLGKRATSEEGQFISSPSRVQVVGKACAVSDMTSRPKFGIW
eukprot:1160755-Pelagomonas_calceolata.AAC.1